MLTRRKLFGTTLVAGAALATSAQQARPQPASKRTIVDAQVHLWKANSPDWAWNPGAKPQLPEPFTIERALPMMDEAGVDRVVIVPPGLNDRNDYALEAAKRYPNRFEVMGRIPLQDPKSAALLPTWKQQPGMLGVRLTFNTPLDARLALRRHRRLVLAGSREGWTSRHVSCGRRGSQVRPHRGAPPAAHAHHRPHGLELIEPCQQDHRESRRRLIRPLRSPNIRTSASSFRVRSAIRSNLIRSAT